MENNAPEMVSIHEAALRTGLSDDCIRRWCLQKKIVFVMSGKKYYINFPLLCEFLNGKTIR